VDGLDRHDVLLVEMLSAYTQEVNLKVL